MPISDQSVDFVYSSHLLEHFTPTQAALLLREISRVLKPSGVVRVVVPDMEDICRNYLASLDRLRSDQSSGKSLHRWATIELLDQLVRQRAGGEMALMHREVRESGDELLRQHIYARTGFDVGDLGPMGRRSLSKKLADLNWSVMRGKIVEAYVALMKRLLPQSLRSLIVDDTSPGEKHKWMYDRESLTCLLQECGFADIRFHTAETSGWAPFLQDNLDLNPDGSAYKRSSLYAEGIKL